MLQTKVSQKKKKSANFAHDSFTFVPSFLLVSPRFVLTFALSLFCYVPELRDKLRELEDQGDVDTGEAISLAQNRPR